MNIGGGGGGGGGSGGGLAMRSSSPFTWSQYQELEQQAMIFKYMMAGVPVPPDLVLPIHKSFESISHRLFQHPAMGYCSFYGKAADPEPGRCRRTDGKKWRCAKEAYPDSKYCERHMHRGRNRSRKPVESHTMMQSLSTVTSLSVSGSSSGSGSFQSIPLHAFGSPQGSVSGTNRSHYTLDSIPYGIPSKDYSCQSRYAQGPKPEGGDRSFFSEPSGSNKGMSIDAQLDNAWSLMHSKVTSYPSKSTDNAMLQRDYTQQHSFYGTEYASSTTKSKQDGQSILPFFDEWPKTQEAWSGLEDDTSNQTSYSTTQLSISMPVPPADYSTTSSHSPQDK